MTETGDNSPSATIIEEAFAASIGLVTISNGRMILTNNRKDGIANFNRLLGRLRVRDPEQQPAKGMLRPLVWIFQFAPGHPSSLPLPEVALFQDCCRELDRDLRDWAAARTTIAISSANPDWVEYSFRDSGLSRKATSGVQPMPTAENFFDTLQNSPWAQYDAFTAFPSQSDRSEMLFYGHTIEQSGLQPYGAKHYSRSKIRNTTVRRLLTISQSIILREIEEIDFSNPVFEQYNIFSFEAFSEIDLS